MKLFGNITFSALPADPVIYKLDDDRFQYIIDDEGITHLVDLWVKSSDLRETARFNPDAQNAYHLFTRYVTYIR